MIHAIVATIFILTVINIYILFKKRDEKTIRVYTDFNCTEYENEKEATLDEDTRSGGRYILRPLPYNPNDDERN